MTRTRRRTADSATILSEPNLNLLLDFPPDELAERIPETCVEVRVVLDQAEARISATPLTRRRRTTSLCLPAIYADSDLLLICDEAATELRTPRLHEHRGDGAAAELGGAIRDER